MMNELYYPDYPEIDRNWVLPTVLLINPLAESQKIFNPVHFCVQAKCQESILRLTGRNGLTVDWFTIYCYCYYVHCPCPCHSFLPFPFHHIFCLWVLRKSLEFQFSQSSVFVGIENEIGEQEAKQKQAKGSKKLLTSSFIPGNPSMPQNWLNKEIIDV